MSETTWVNVMDLDWSVIESNVRFNASRVVDIIKANFLLSKMSFSDRIKALTRFRMLQNATDDSNLIENEM